MQSLLFVMAVSLVARSFKDAQVHSQMRRFIHRWAGSFRGVQEELVQKLTDVIVGKAVVDVLSVVEERRVDVGELLAADLQSPLRSASVPRAR